MTEIFNKYKEKEKRRLLRRNMPEAELLLWEEIRNRKIIGKRFLRQYSIYSSVVDFYCPKLKLVIELDGKYHTKKENAENDMIRQKCIEELGIQFLRFKNKEIENDMKRVVEEIKCKIKELEGKEPSSSPIVEVK